MITYFINQNAFYFDTEMNCIVMLDVHAITDFMLSIIFLNETNCIINNGNILTDGRNERKYIQRKYNEM